LVIQPRAEGAARGNNSERINSEHRMPGTKPEKSGRFEVLDGWRGISVLVVLACHLLPLGPKPWLLNASAGLFGMALFFTLSGFLITTFLLRKGDLADFLVRRICRIVPLAWLALPFGLWLAHARWQLWLPNFLFVANYPPFWFTPVTFHYWSLCVEMQFYAAVALVYGLCGRRGLLIGIPLGAAAITSFRIYTHTYYDFSTYTRVDEILSGGILALAYAGELGAALPSLLRRLNWIVMLALLAASSLPICGPLNYARPYFAAALVGCTLMQPESSARRLLASGFLAYIAEISYALYIVHPILSHTWLGSGNKIIRYAKRPLLFAAIWLVAHVSTRHYESFWIGLGKRYSLKRRAIAVPAAT
jgi:peptidoglycan/LPS O-acetylase OafA/YrhL